MEISFEGIGQVYATFEAEPGVEPGMAVAMTGNGKVGLGEAGATLCGVALTVKNGMAAVQVEGMAKVACSGTVPQVGVNDLACDGSGGVSVVTEGGSGHLAVWVEPDGGAAVIKL